MVYYRGYRLACWGNITYIYWQRELIDTTHCLASARVMVDDWLHAA